MDQRRAELTTILADRQGRIAQLDAILPLATDPQLQATLTAQRTSYLAEIATLQAELTQLDTLSSPPSLPPTTPTRGNVTNTGTVHGVLAGVVLGNIIYGQDPQEDARGRLVRYLDRVEQQYGRLSLRGLTVPKGGIEDVALDQVYITLATTHHRTLVEGDAGAVSPYLVPEALNLTTPLWDRPHDPRRPEFHPDQALPDTAIVAVHPPQFSPASAGDDTSLARGRSARERRSSFFGGQNHTGETPALSRPHWRLDRAELAIETMAEQRQLILLGDPGGGKSVLLRQVAWTMARQGRDATSGTMPRLPLLLSLRRLAGALASAVPGQGVGAVLVQLADQVAQQQLASGPIADVVREALYHGAVLLLLDGLDEVPLVATPQSVSRAQLVAAIRQLSADYSTVAVIVTCRVRAFDAAMGVTLGWPVRTLAPWTRGQICHFLVSWYGVYRDAGLIDTDQQAGFQNLILTAIATNERLHAMATSPLLLTLMAQIVYNDSHLPRDRPQLYERMLELLLGQWDTVQGGQDLASVLGSGWDSKRLRKLLDQLSYVAHRDATSLDGRGRLSRAVVRTKMIDYFASHQQADAWALAGACLDYIEQRSGLLVPDGPDDYVFAHLTFQEHCAGRYLLTNERAAALVSDHRADDRWREPLMLGLGVIQEHNPALVSQILRDLIEPDEADTSIVKPSQRWYHDLVLAVELGADRDWSYMKLQGVDVDRLQRDLRQGFVSLLGNRAQPLSVSKRVQIGFVLGALGDPRIPVTIDDWQREVDRIVQGDERGYFCRIPAGTYLIGSRDDDDEAQEEEQPQHPFILSRDLWMARYPFTNSQWHILVGGGLPESGLAQDSEINKSNQPVVGLSWDTIVEGCAWLTTKLRVAFRLPTEYEWEAAARGVRAFRYPWGYNWRADRAASEENRDIRGTRWTTPVGCFPAGASPFGALDMAGNVWEWCMNTWSSYPGSRLSTDNPSWRVVRGGAYADKQIYLRSTRRSWHSSGGGFGSAQGFRICVDL